MAGRIRTIQPGEWVQPKRRGYRLVCCGCGLTHVINFRLAKLGKARLIQLQMFIDHRATAQHRRHK
jgi:hypothetical protein